MSSVVLAILRYKPFTLVLYAQPISPCPKIVSFHIFCSKLKKCGTVVKQGFCGFHKAPLYHSLLSDFG